MIDALYRVPLTFSDNDDGVTNPGLSDAGWTRTPSLRMPGSRDGGPGGNFFLVHALVNDDLTAQEIEDLIAGPCLGALSWPEIPAVYDFVNLTPVVTPEETIIIEEEWVDPDGNTIPAVVEVIPEHTDMEPTLITPAFRTQIIAVDEPTIIDFLNDVDDIGTRPTDLSVMHIFSGRDWLL